MNVSIKTSCFRGKTPTESSCRQSRPDRSSSASRGWVHVPCTSTCTGLQVGQFRVFCESVPRQVRLVGLLVLPGAATGTQVLQFDKKIRSVPYFLQPPAIDKEPESNAKMYVNQRRDEMARTWKHILRHDHFRAKYRYVGVFFERRFKPLSVGGFFSNQRESIIQCPKSPFPSKTQNRQIARTSPLRMGHCGCTGFWLLRAFNFFNLLGKNYSIILSALCTECAARSFQHWRLAVRETFLISTGPLPSRLTISSEKEYLWIFPSSSGLFQMVSNNPIFWMTEKNPLVNEMCE